MERRLLKVVGLGVVIWSLSLIWPQVNRVLTMPVMAGIVLVLATIVLVHVFNSTNDQGPSDDEPGEGRASQPVLVDLSR